MAVVDDDIWVGFGVGNGPEAGHLPADDLVVGYGGVEVAVPKEAETEEGEGDVLAEKDTADAGGNVCEGVADTADDDVLEESCLAAEG